VPARLSPTERIRAQIDELFAGGQPLAETLEEAARLSVRLVIQAALEAEVSEFLGRDRYQRDPDAGPGYRNGHQPVQVKTTAGPVVLERPKLRDTGEPFVSRLLGKGVSRTNALEALVLASFVRGLSVRDVEAALAEALGPEAALSKSTVCRICQAIKEAEWGSDLKVSSARKAYERLESQPIKITEGNPETPYAFEMPKWWEMREGVSIPAIPIGKPMEGGKGYVPERNPYFKKFTTRTMRPVIDFDKCVKCTLCWIQCPDSCFDVTPDGLYDANMEACCGCGVCEAVCPAKDCVTMVREDAFEDNASQWEMWRKDKGTYKTWMTDKIHSKEHITRSHGFRFRGQYEQEIKQELETGGIEIIAGIPGENAEAKK
jgi:Pyruvate/2-oxoacid:ferredoxin oxidoreductase delta subunit